METNKNLIYSNAIRIKSWYIRHKLKAYKFYFVKKHQNIDKRALIP